MKTFNLGHSLSCDLDILIQSRLLVQASSGQGKTRTIRRLLEQSHGMVQHLVIDPEGEYHTLREKFDYVLAAPRGGDVVAHPKHAAALAEELLKLQVSAILDIYELNPLDRKLFVKNFVMALVDAPRELWHPCLVVIDEIHNYCPEKGEAASAEAIEALSTRGRKRGFCLIAATQRIAKFKKDAAAELANKLIGGSNLDIDVDRAGEDLGFVKADRAKNLRGLEPGTFWAFGRAFNCLEPKKVMIGSVATTHPKPGEAAPPVKPPTERIKATLAKLSALPVEAEKKRQTLEDLQQQVHALEGKLHRAQANVPDVGKIERVEVPVFSAALEEEFRQGLNSLNEQIMDVRNWIENSRHWPTHLNVLADRARGLGDLLNDLVKSTRHTQPTRSTPQPATARQLHAPPASQAGRAVPSNGSRPAGLGKSQRTILAVLARHGPCQKGKLTLLAGLSWTGTFRTYLSELRTSGFIAGDNGGVMEITQGGRAQLGDYDPLPTGAELRDYWCANPRFNVTERAILEALIDHPAGLSSAALCRAVGKEWTGTLRTYLSNLRTAGVIVGKNNEVLQANPEMFNA